MLASTHAGYSGEFKTVWYNCHTRARPPARDRSTGINRPGMINDPQQLQIILFHANYWTNLKNAQKFNIIACLVF